MSEVPNKLIALIFDDKYKAEEARAALHRMEGEGLLDIDETAVIIKKEDGKLSTSQDINHVAHRQHVGHLVGLVCAAATGIFPFIMGATLAGRLVGTLTDNGITNKFIKQVTAEVQPGTSVLILLARSDAARRQKVIERLKSFKPKVLESDLPPHIEKELEAELQHQMDA